MYVADRIGELAEADKDVEQSDVVRIDNDAAKNESDAIKDESGDSKNKSDAIKDVYVGDAVKDVDEIDVVKNDHDHNGIIEKSCDHEEIKELAESKEMDEDSFFLCVDISKEEKQDESAFNDVVPALTDEIESGKEENEEVFNNQHSRT